MRAKVREPIGKKARRLRERERERERERGCAESYVEKVGRRACECVCACVHVAYVGE